LAVQTLRSPLSAVGEAVLERARIFGGEEVDGGGAREREGGAADEEGARVGVVKGILAA
jgi:hypothetical protein